MVRNQNDEHIKIPTGDAAPNGVLLELSGGLVTNASNNVSITNVAPAAVGTATISGWLNVNINGVTYFIPVWT